MNSNVIQNDSTYYYEIWVEYNDYKIEKVATTYNRKLAYAIRDMLQLKRDAETVVGYWIGPVAK